MKNFNFDEILISDGDLKNFEQKLKYKNQSKDNLLLITLNHRSFSLKQKNNIKFESDYLNLNHLMFSIRPSLSDFLKKILKDEINIILQSFFLFHVLEKYEIKKVLIEKRYFKNLKIEEDLLSLSNILFKIKKKINDKYLLNNNHNKELTFFNSINLNKKYNKIKLTILKSTSREKNLKINKQIKKSEEDIFFIGFDSKFKDIPWEKKHKREKVWNNKIHTSGLGNPLFSNIKYCLRCCLPETSEGIKFDKLGICSLCSHSEDKMNINWKERGTLLKKIINNMKNKNNYDSILPISGGKDSTFQCYVLKKVYKTNPLTITHGTNWLTIVGRFNLENCLKQFDLDHLFFVPSRNIINHVARESLKNIGDSCWHCHTGVGVFPLQTATRWKIKLIVYGEAPADTDPRGNHKIIENIKPDRFLKISSIKKVNKFTNQEFNKKKLSHWLTADSNIIKTSKIKIIYLGQYIFWDEQKNIDLIMKEFGWKNSRVENTYKGYKSNDCVMAGVHDYFNFLKRGIGRSTVHAAEDVRRGLIYREDGFELAKKYDTQKPHALEYYKKITKLNNNEIKKFIIKNRNTSKYSAKLNNEK